MVYNELNNFIGRITTSGVVTNYAGPAIDVPGASVAGPYDALWFTKSQESRRSVVSRPREL